MNRPRLTQRGHDLLWACRLVAALLISLALVATIDNWI